MRVATAICAIALGIWVTCVPASDDPTVTDPTVEDLCNEDRVILLAKVADCQRIAFVAPDGRDYVDARREIEIAFSPAWCTAVGVFAATSSAAGTAVVNIEAYRSCLGATKGVEPCDAVLRAGEFNGPKPLVPSGCPVFRGLLHEGESCYSSLECGDGLYCSGDSCPGLCTPWRHPGDDCNREDACDPTESTCNGFTCVALHDLGTKCNAHACRTGICDFQEAMEWHGTPTCLPVRVDAGGKCGLVDDSWYGFCRAGKYCSIPPGSTLVGECTVTVGVGGACLGHDECEDGLVCLAGLCAAGGGPGDACNEADPCDGRQRCLNGVCVGQSADGEACQYAIECTSRFCANGVCTAAADLGLTAMCSLWQ